MTSIFEGQPPKTRPFPIKTRVIWVPGIYIYIIYILLYYILYILYYILYILYIYYIYMYTHKGEVYFWKIS